MKKSLEMVIRAALNEHNAEAGSNTPDYVLARYLMACLNAFNDGIKERNRWAALSIDKVKTTGDKIDIK